MQSSRLTKKVMVMFALCFAVILIGLVVYGTSRKTGDVQIIFNSLPDSQKITATLDGKTFKIGGLKGTYQIKPGSHALSIAKPGYAKLVTNFTNKMGQTLLINADLKRPVLPTIPDLQSAFHNAPVLDGFTLNNVEYFYQNSWAFVGTLSSYGQTTFVVAKYEDALNSWQIIFGPGTSYPDSATTQLPGAVASYLQDNYYVDQGDGRL